MNKKLALAILRYAAVLGNLVFFLWILYNGIDEGFQGTRVELVSSITLMGLLCLNGVLLSLKTSR